MTQQPVRWGLENLVNTTTDDHQVAGKAIGLADGKFVVVWADRSYLAADGYGWGVKAQMYDALGNKLGGELTVNTTTVGDQREPQAVALPDGGFAVTWLSVTGASEVHDIAAQRFDGKGQKVGAEIIVTASQPGIAVESSIAVLESGGFAIAWQHYNTATQDRSISLQRFGDDGQPAGNIVTVNNLNSSSQMKPSITAIGNERFAVVWEDFSQSADDLSQGAIRMKIFADNGALVLDETLVNTTTAGSQTVPSIAALDSGRFVVSWTDTSQTFAAGPTIVGQIFNNDGGKVGNEFRVVGVGTPVDALHGSKLVGLPDGSFFAVYVKENTGGDADEGVFGQLRDKNGVAIGGEFRLNTTVSGYQVDPNVGLLADGRIVVTWTDDSKTAPDTDGVAARMQILDPRGGQIFGTANSETLAGSNSPFSNGNDTFHGGGGNDTYLGLNGSDTVSYKFATAAVTVDLTKPSKNKGDALGDVFNSIENVAGSSFNDTLTGDAGDNILEGGLGADKLTGGAGIDTASYENATVGVLVNLLKPNMNTGEAQGDKYSSIENLTGSAFGDALTAGNAGHTLNGLGGNDFLIGGKKSDVLIGGSDNDAMAGGLGNDTFRFAMGFGKDTITDFAAGAALGDVIDFDGVFADFAAVMAAVQQVGADVLITFDTNNTIKLLNVTVAQLNANDFSF